MKDSFSIIAFRAVDEPGLCQEYVNGHIQVLKDFGIENVTSNNETWTSNPNMYCLILSDERTGQKLGGIRIQVADGIFNLPIEDAIAYIEPRITGVVEKFALDGGVGELCGLWVSNKLKGLGMGTYLVRAAIASSHQLKFRTMIGICAKYSLQMFKNVGFVIDKSLGDQGDFSYPNEHYIAHVVGILDALTLNSSHPHDKAIMEALRKELKQVRNENDKGETVRIKYNLIYPKIVETPYMNQHRSLSPMID